MVEGLLTGCRPIIGMDGCHLNSAQVREKVDDCGDCSCLFAGDENFEVQEKGKNVLNLEKRVCDYKE